MSDDLNTELRFGADTTGAEAGVNRVKRSLKDLGDSANKASKDAGDSLGRVGAGGDKAAKDVDRATKTMQSSLQRVIASFEGGEKGSRQFYESLARQRNVDVNTLKPLLDQLDAVKAKSQAAAQASVQVGSSFTGLGAAAGLAARAFAVIGVGASVGEFVRLADASTNVASRLGLVTSSAAELASVQQRLFSIAQSSRVSFVDLVGTYAQVARSTKDLGVSQTALLGVIQTISQAVTISGGSAASAQAALTQLSQGFASGALRGEELNSILEQTPRLAQALADGLGVGVGKLRELGQAGELTSEKVLGALEKSAAGVAAEFGKMAVTVEQASTNAANSALKLVGALDKITGASAATAGGITRLSAGMDSLTLDIERLSSSKGLSDFFFLAFNNERSLNGELEITQKELAGLEARLAKAPSNIYTRSAVAEMREYVKELKEAQARLAALSGQSGPTDPRDQSGFTGRGASYANEAKRQAKLAEDANSFRLNQAGVPASYLKDMAELIRLNQAGVIVGKEYTDALKKQQDILLQKTGTTKGAATAAKAEQSAYETLISSIRAKIEADKLELAGGAALTESQRIRIKLDQDMAAGRVKLSAQNERAVRLALQELSASEAAAMAAKTLAASYAEAAAERLKIAQSMEKSADAFMAQNDALREEIELIGLSTEQQTLVLQQRNDVIILTKEATLAELERQSAITGTQTRVEIALSSEIEALKERNALLGAKGVKEAAKQAESEWARSVEKYEDIFRQGFADMLNSGKDGWKSFTKSLVTTFKTTVADQIYKMFAKPFVMKLVASLVGITGGGIASAATGGGDLVGTASNVGSAYRAASGFNTGWLTDFGATMPGSIASTGANLYSQGFETVGSSMMDFGNSIAGYADAINTAGDVLGYGAAIFAAANGKWGQAIGSAVGAYFGGPIGSFIGSTLGKWTDKIFSGGAGTPHSGGGLIYSAANGIRGGAENYKKDTFGFGNAKEYNPEVEKLIGPLAIGLVTTFDGIAKTFGKTAGYEIATAFADDTSKDGAWGSLRISQGGKDLLNWEDTRKSKWAPKEFANGEEGYKEYLAEIAKDTRTVLLEMDLPSWADTMLESIGDAANMDQLSATVQQIGAIQTTFVQLGKTMEGFAGLTDKAFEALMRASGGLEALSANAGTYYENFYSEAEKAAAVTRSVSDALAQVGVAMPATRDEFRTLVESQLALGESGAEAAAALLGVSGAFASVTSAAQDAVAAEARAAESQYAEQMRQVADAANERQRITDGLLSDQASVGIALLRAMGKEEEAVAAERAIAIKGMDAYQTALYDSNQAIRDQIAGLEKQAEATKLAQERAAELASTLAGELPGAIAKFLSPDQKLTAGYTGIASDLSKVGINVGADALAAASLDQIAAAAMAVYNLGTTSDETRLALVRAVSGLADLKTESNSVAEAARQAAAQQRAGLETRLLQLQGNTVELRNREVAALEPANRALQRQIYALEDLAAAQGRLDAASSAIANEYLSAQSALESAQQGVAEATRQTAQEMLNFGNSIVEFLNRLQTTDMGNTSPESRYQAAAEQFRSTAAMAQSGDRDALGRITSVATDYLGASKAYYASGSGFSMDEGAVKSALQQILGVTGSGTAASSGVDPMTRAQEELVKAMERMNEIQEIVSATGVSTSVAATDLLGAFLSAQADVAKATADEAIWRAADKTAWDARDTLQQVLTDASLITSAQTQDSGVTLDYINTSNATIQAAAQTQTTILTAMATSSAATRESSEKTAQTTEAVLHTLNEVLAENRNMAGQLAALRQKVAEMESNQRLAASAPAKV